MNFTCSFLAPDALPCGNGRGACVAQDTCACPPGWIGAADFMPGNSSNCDSFVPAISGLWAAAIATNVVALGINGRAFSTRFAKEVALFNAAKAKYADLNVLQRLRRRGIHLRDAFYLEAFGLALASLFFIIVAALRIAQPDVTIGTGVTVTVFLALGTVCFWIPIVSALGFFIILGAKQARTGLSTVRVHDTVRRVRVLIPVGIACALVAAALPLGMLGTEDYKPLLASLHYASVAFLLAVPGVFAHLVTIMPLIRDLRASLDAMREQADVNRAPIEHVLRILERGLGEAVRTGTFQAIVCILFASWPWLTRKSSYMQAIAWLNGGFSSAVIGTTLLSASSTSDAGTAPMGEKRTSSRHPISSRTAPTNSKPLVPNAKANATAGTGGSSSGAANNGGGAVTPSLSATG